MKNFSAYLHNKVRLIFKVEKVIELNSIYCQYNPDRFDSYAKCIYKIGNPLSIYNSPHYDLIKRYIQFGSTRLMLHVKGSNYWQMQRLYGRDDKWILEKIQKFIHLYELMSTGLVADTPEVLLNPIVINPYNNGCEIYEGHHRLAILANMNVPKVNCKLYDWEEDE